MKFETYSQYKEATIKYYEEKGFKNPSIMVLDEETFNKFNGVIEFGAGSKNLTNNYNCDSKCKNCNCN